MSWRLKAALLWSLAGHLFLLGGLGRWSPAPSLREGRGPSSSRSPGRTVELAVVAASVPPGPAAQPTVLGAPVTPPLGPADVWTPVPASPAPRADVDTPDPKAAARGGGNVGAPLRYTGRADRGDLRTLPWNDPQAYRLPRHDDGYRRAAPESINRRPEPGLDTQERDRVPTARLAEPAPAPGPTPGEAPGRARPSPPPAEAGTVATAPSAADPAPPAPPAQAARDGAVISRRADPGAETGARATEAERRGPTGDNTTSAQASNERDPGPIEFTRPSAGGTSGGGVAGPNPGAGNSAASPRAGAGQGGTPAAIARGDAAPATRARPQDVYLRRLFRLLADAVEYPADLALGLEQGELVVRFTLLADGSVAELTIARSSGIRAFDDAALAAVRKVTPLGPVPKAVLAGRDRLRVEWPLAFSAPMIR